MTNETVLDVTEILNALETWIKQRSRLDPRDYWTNDAWNARSEGRKAFRQEARSIAKDRVRAMQALKEARLMDARPEVLADSFRAFSGRLEWKYSMIPCTPRTFPSCGCGGEHLNTKGHLSYTTGQYWPTEYRKAAASVLETYVAACKQATPKRIRKRSCYTTLDDVRNANEKIGAHWFDKSSMRFFKTRIESRLIAGKRFITSECGPDERRKYTIREAQPDGMIDTIGGFQGFNALRQAKAHVLMSKVEVDAA